MKPKFLADGVLVVDKPVGPTSHDVVDRLRRRFRPAKLGHAGTLDPFAEGVLVLVFNRATRMANLLGAGDKLYRGRIRLGQATDTGDPTGQVVDEREVHELSRARLEEALAGLVGSRMQTPPAYSAVKHQGKPLYAYARQGIEVNKPPRAIEIHQARLLGYEAPLIDFDILCSKGTYVRSLAEDLAESLGTLGHLISLRRLASAPFGEGEALSLDQVLDLEPAELEQRLTGLSQSLERCGLPAVELDEEYAWQLRQGRILPREVLTAGSAGVSRGRGPFRVLDGQGELVAVLRWLEAGERRPGRDYESIRVFPERQIERSVSHTSASAMGAE